MARITTNLNKYLKSKRQAKEALRLVKSVNARAFAEAYSEYQKEYYRISKSLRTAGVKLSAGHNQGIYKAGVVRNFAARGEVMSISEFIRYTKKYADLSATQIAAKQYNLIDTNTAALLQRNLKEAGLGDYSLDLIRARQLPQEV